jgi:hypothetical protein
MTSTTREEMKDFELASCQRASGLRSFLAGT